MYNYNLKHIMSFLSQLLHPNYTVEIQPIFEIQEFWNKVVKIGSAHLVLPAIYGGIKRKKLVNHIPAGLINYLDEISNLNHKQNIKILKQIAFISKIFEKNQIEYVFLKGAALLITKPYETIKERMVGDIDILVAEKDLVKAQKILIMEGFQETSKIKLMKGLNLSRHLKRITHPDFISAVEIHRRIFDYNRINIISSNEILKNKLKTSEGYCVPSKFHLWLHAILNWQYNDNGIQYNTLSLRAYMDVVHLEPENIGNDIIISKPVSHFYSLCSVLVDIYKKSNYLSALIFKYKLIFPKFRYTYDYLIKLKIIFLMILTRLKFALNSKIYRRRVLKNLNLVVKRISIFWKKN